MTSSKKFTTIKDVSSLWMGLDVKDFLSDSALSIGAGSPTDAGAGWSLPKEHPDPIIAAGGIPDEETLPVKGLREALDNVLTSEAYNALKYGGILGFEGLRSILAQRQSRLDGMKLEPENFILHNGSSGCLDNVCKAFVMPEDVVIVEAPAYSGTVRTIRGSMAQVIEVRVDDDGLSVDGVDTAIKQAESSGKRVKFVYVNPDFQNPTATTMSEGRRVELIKLCADHKVLIIEDATYSELYFDQPPPESMYAMSKGQGVIKIGTFSKIIATGLRIGWVQARKDYIDDMARVRFDMGNNPLLLRALAQYIESGKLDPHIQRMRPIYAEKCAVLSQSLLEHCRPYVRFKRPAGGFFFWFECIGASAEEVCKAAAEEGLLIPPGNQFYLDKEQANHSYVRLAFSNASLEHLSDVGRRLRAAFLKVVD